MTTARVLWLSVMGAAPLMLLGAAENGHSPITPPQTQTDHSTRSSHEAEQTMKVHYLEIVTTSVDETCDALAAPHGITFSDPIPELGDARTADLAGQGRIGVRAPMHDAEQPVVRPYVLVDDIQAAVTAAENAGATIALPPMNIPGQGTCAIYILGGIEHGLWQL